METTTSSKSISNRNRIGIGIALLVIGLLMFAFFARNAQPGQTATFGMNLNGSTEVFTIPDLVLPVQTSL